MARPPVGFDEPLLRVAARFMVWGNVVSADAACRKAIDWLGIVWDGEQWKAALTEVEGRHAFERLRRKYAAQRRQLEDAARAGGQVWVEASGALREPLLPDEATRSRERAARHLRQSASTAAEIGKMAAALATDLETGAPRLDRVRALAATAQDADARLRKVLGAIRAATAADAVKKPAA